MIVSATSNYSRNYQCGYLIGKGYDIKENIRQVGMAVEGINVIPEVISMAEYLDIEMPILFAVNQVINHKVVHRDV